MIFRLAVKDLVHDWLLSTCLVLAVASIIAPLLILFGLKAGTIQTMRGRLVEDPKNREIRPLSAHSFSRDWFERIREQHPEISFVIPMTRQISTAVMARGPAGDRTSLSLLATGDNDPLLLENGSGIPDREGCVLTAPAARELKAGTGDTIEVTVTRIIHSRRQKASLALTVSGVLAARASGLKGIFVRLPVLEAVEDYRDGRAVPAYGWQGTLPGAYPVFDGVVVAAARPLARLDQIMLINSTGFSSIRELAADATEQLIGFSPDPGRMLYLVSVKKNPVDEESVKAVQRRLRGKGAVLLPWVRPFSVSLGDKATGRVDNIRLFALAPSAARISTLDPGALFADQADIAFGDSGPVTVMTLTVSRGGRRLTMPVRVRGTARPGARGFIRAGLAGRLDLLSLRNVAWDPKGQALLISRRGYAGFRLYAATIDQVAGIRDMLQAQGITVRTEEERIAEVRRLDRYLSLIFWLIATVGVIGGISALTASLYASVERKRRELNILRLLGLLRRQIVLFPVIQGLTLSGCGLGLAGLVFWGVATVINRLFQDHLQGGESLCTLSPVHVAWLIGGLCLCAVFSATLAALQAIRLDPAEALRDE